MLMRIFHPRICTVALRRDGGNNDFFSKAGKMKRKRRYIAFFFSLIFFTLLGCRRQTTDEFPVFTENLSVTSAATENTFETAPGESVSLPRLSAALPITQEIMDQLIRLYSAKQLSSSHSNSSVDLDGVQIENQEPLFAVDVIPVPETGATVEDILLWPKSSMTIPDIIYAEKISDLVTGNILLPLDMYLADNSLFLSTRMYTSSLEPCRVRSTLYGIPFRGAARVLFLDTEIIENAGIAEVPYLLDINGFTLISERVASLPSEETPPEQWVLPLYDAGDLLALLPSSFSQQAGWFTYRENRFHFDSPSFMDSISFLREYRQAGNTAEAMTDEQRSMLFAETDPRFSGHVAMWVGRMDELDEYSRNGTRKISFSQIPSATYGETTPPAVTVFPLCISAETNYPDLAASFASFLALDEDALLLQNESFTQPLFPLVTSEKVWASLYDDDTTPKSLWASLRTGLQSAYFDPETGPKKLSEKIDGLIAENKSILLDSEMNVTDVINILLASTEFGAAG